MSHKFSIQMIIGAFCLLIFGGCEEQLSLDFTANESAMYMVTKNTIEGQKRPRGKKADVRFVQKIEEVDEAGNAVVDIRVEGIEYLAKDKDGTVFDYNSNRTGDQDNPLTRLIGQSYKIEISQNGRVTVLDAETIRNLVKGGQEAVIAKSLLSDKNVKKRHTTIYSLPPGKPVRNKKDSWVEIPRADLRLKPAVDDSTMYKFAEHWVSSLRFEQPSLNKLDEKKTGTNIEMKFLQRIESVDKEGNAIARVTIKAFKYHVMVKNEVTFDFDSTREADKDRALSKLIGQSFTIKISPDGGVEVVDAKKARNAVKGGSDGTAARGLLSKELIAKRHSILALPDAGNRVVSVPQGGKTRIYYQGDSWIRIKPSHPALKWAPKSLAKTYTLEQITKEKRHRVALITMNGAESVESAEDAPESAGLMGIFGNIFDPQEIYTGRFTLDLDTGKVMEYNEKFVGTYTAMDTPKGKDSDKGPDVLTMGFTHEISMEMSD